MLTPELKEVLSEGLLNGYIADNAIFGEKRGSFSFNGTSYSNNGSYEDRWVGERSGGGQEVVEINGQKYTRLYAGGCLDDTELSKLGITKQEIGIFRSEAIKTLKDKTRLDEMAFYESKDGKWDYGYDIVDSDSDKDFGLLSTREIILYKDETVFVHRFMLCPVK